MQHIASLTSLSGANEQLLQAAEGLDDAGLNQLGRELAAVSDLLSGQPALRRTLSEATTGVDVRAGILRRLLSGKIGEPALATVDDVVRRDWSSGADLRDAFARLSRTARFRQAERDGDLDRVEDELFRFGRIVDGAPELSVLLDDPTTPGPERADLVRRLLTDRVHPLTLDLLIALARDPGGRSFSVGVRELVDQAAQRRDKLVAVVESALPLTSSEQDRLTAALSRIYARGVVVHSEVNPELRGGLRVRVGDEQIDGSVAGRLDDLRRRLAS